MICPFCESENVVQFCERFHCKDCDRLFDDDDIVRENLRHRLSAILSANYATGDSPLEFSHPIGEWDEDTVGLSSLNLPWSKSVFEFQDGTIWFNLDYTDSEPINFDDVCTRDLQDIIEVLEGR